MREIKFRAWDKRRKLMIWTDYPENWWNDKDECYDDIACMDITWIENISKDKNYEIMQYTWLKDKNWKEVYEWDVVKMFDSILTIKYWIVEVNPDDLWYNTTLVWFYWENKEWVVYDLCWELEKIWNFYETPQLLKN